MVVNLAFVVVNFALVVVNFALVVVNLALVVIEDNSLLLKIFIVLFLPQGVRVELIGKRDLLNFG